MDRCTFTSYRLYLATGRSMLICSAWSWRTAPIAPTAIEEGEIMRPGTPLFESPAFQLYWEDAMTTLQEMGEQPFTLNSLVLIVLKSADKWDQEAAFVALMMCRKMEKAGAAKAAHSRRHHAPNAGTHRLPSCLPLATQQWKRKKTIQAGLTRRHPLAAKIPAKPRILNEGRV